MSRPLTTAETEHLLQYKLALQCKERGYEVKVHTHGKNGSYIELDTIKTLLNGFGRAVYFESQIDISKSLKSRKIEDNEIYMDDRVLLSQVEGRFVNGSIDGYARKFDSDGSCKVGYWKPVDPPKLKKGEEVPIYLPFSGPFGKWAYYK